MLEEQIRELRVGYRIGSEAMNDLLHPENKLHEDAIHVQRIDAFGRNTGVWEAMGYLAGVFRYFPFHPLEGCKIITKRD